MTFGAIKIEMNITASAMLRARETSNFGRGAGPQRRRKSIGARLLLHQWRPDRLTEGWVKGEAIGRLAQTGPAPELTASGERGSRRQDPAPTKPSPRLR